MWCVCLATLCFAQTSVAGTTEDEIAARLERVGTVCVEGQECGGAAMAAPTAVAGAAADGPADTYKKSCATCHAIGLAGAPTFGNKEAWAPHIAKGLDVLYSSAIGGLPTGMPARGMCFTCSDDDLKAVVDYMVNAGK